jgi:hypothetical protein
MAKGTSIVVPGEMDSPLIVLEKADFHMTVPGLAVSQMTDRTKVDSLTVGRERPAFRRIAREKEAPAQSDPLTENQVQDPADSVTATGLFCAIGKVPGRKQFSERQ